MHHTNIPTRLSNIIMIKIFEIINLFRELFTKMLRTIFTSPKIKIGSSGFMSYRIIDFLIHR